MRYQGKYDAEVQIDVVTLGIVQVEFSTQGGGFLKTMARDKFDATFELAPLEREYYAATVTVEWMEDRSLPCYTNGDLWNGWGRPQFDRENMLIILGMMVSPGDPPIVTFDPERDALVFADGEDEPYVCPPKAIVVDGKELLVYEFDGWCWEQPERVTPVPVKVKKTSGPSMGM